MKEIPASLYQITGLDVSAGISYCGDAEDYLFAVKAFQERVAENAAEIEKYRLAGDIANMAVKVHGVKSTARAIGALELGDLAEMIEKAGKEDRDIPDADIEKFLSDYRELGKALSSVDEDDEAGNVSAADAQQTCISEDDLKDILDRLKKHSENADYDEIDRIGEQLTASEVPPQYKDLVHRICTAISDLDYDELTVILGERS